MSESENLPGFENGEANENFKAGITPMGIGIAQKPQVASENENVRNWLDGGSANKTSQDPMAMAREKMLELRQNGLLKTPLQKFIENPRPMRAIRRFCYECNGYSMHEATNCQTRQCPLWLFRRGTTIVNPNELIPWQNAYSQWMKSVGEFTTNTADGEDVIDDESDGDDTESAE